MSLKITRFSEKSLGVAPVGQTEVVTQVLHFIKVSEWRHSTSQYYQVDYGQEPSTLLNQWVKFSWLQWESFCSPGSGL